MFLTSRTCLSYVVLDMAFKTSLFDVPFRSSLPSLVELLEETRGRSGFEKTFCRKGIGQKLSELMDRPTVSEVVLKWLLESASVFFGFWCFDEETKSRAHLLKMCSSFLHKTPAKSIRRLQQTKTICKCMVSVHDAHESLKFGKIHLGCQLFKPNKSMKSIII